MRARPRLHISGTRRFTRLEPLATRREKKTERERERKREKEKKNVKSGRNSTPPSSSSYPRFLSVSRSRSFSLGVLSSRRLPSFFPSPFYRRFFRGVSETENEGREKKNLFAERINTTQVPLAWILCQDIVVDATQ